MSVAKSKYIALLKNIGSAIETEQDNALSALREKSKQTQELEYTV